VKYRPIQLAAGFQKRSATTALYQMQSHMAILIAYCIGMKKDHQTLLNFAILAGKWQKRTFSYKVACKKLSWSGQRGGASNPPPLNTPLVDNVAVLVQISFYYSCAPVNADTKNVRCTRRSGDPKIFFMFTI